MAVTFDYVRENSSIFGEIHRPIADVDFWSEKFNRWETVTMIVDTGADYTVMPHYLADVLGINLETDSAPFYTFGVGGRERIYVVQRHKVKLGIWERSIPIGFLEKDTVPPLLGRHLFMETFDALFTKKHQVIFEE